MKVCMFVYKIRNSKEVRDMCINKNPIKLSDHKKWFEKHKKKIKIIGNYYGYYFIDDNGFISICIHKDYRGKGYALKTLKKLNGKAIILLHNEVSLNCFVNSGFRIKGFYLEK